MTHSHINGPLTSYLNYSFIIGFVLPGMIYHMTKTVASSPIQINRQPAFLVVFLHFVLLSHILLKNGNIVI